MSQRKNRHALLLSARGLGSGGSHLELELMGETILQKLLKSLRSAGVTTCWLAVDRPCSTLRDAVSESGVQILDLPDEAAALTRIREDRAAASATLLILPAELPLLQTGTVRRLFEVVESDQSRVALLEPAKIGGAEAAAVCIGAPESDSSTLAETGDVSLESLASRLRPNGLSVTASSALETTRVVDLESLAMAEGARRHEIRIQWLRSGVRMQEPQSVSIDEQVEIGAGTTLGPGVILRGACRIGRNCRLGPWTLLEDAEVGDGTLVDHCSVIRQSSVGANSTVGPFAHLRAGSRVGDRTRVGNFVEVKKSHLGHGTKAAHLAYLGDAAIGTDCNIGAGAITCNYDGRQKHQTTIGDGSFIGSDCQLIAPVTIGPGSYVAAGSTITEDVPPGALGIARGRQVNKLDWAKKK